MNKRNEMKQKNKINTIKWECFVPLTDRVEKLGELGEIIPPAGVDHLLEQATNKTMLSSEITKKWKYSSGNCCGGREGGAVCLFI